MVADRLQCLFCGYPLDPAESVCPVYHPHSEMPDHVKRQWAVAHHRGLILHLAKDGAVVREASLWEEQALLENDARPLLARMEEDGEIDRFAGYYQARATPETSP